MELLVRVGAMIELLGASLLSLLPKEGLCNLRAVTILKHNIFVKCFDGRGSRGIFGSPVTVRGSSRFSQSSRQRREFLAP